MDFIVRLDWLVSSGVPPVPYVAKTVMFRCVAMLTPLYMIEIADALKGWHRFSWGHSCSFLASETRNST